MRHCLSVWVIQSRSKFWVSGIHDKFKSVQYQEVEDAVGLMRTIGKNCGLFKLDIQNAYKIVPIHCSDWELLGFTLDNEYFF